MRVAVAAFSLFAFACSSFESTGAVAVDSGTDASATDAGAQPEAAAPRDAGTDASVCKLVKPYTSKNVACNTCAERSCCREINLCYLDPDCDDGYVNCILACALDADASTPDATPQDAGINLCLTECGTQHKRGKREYDDAIGCAETACPTECR